VRATPTAVTRIIVRFECYSGRYVWRCRLLEHEDNEMMRPFEVLGGRIIVNAATAGRSSDRGTMRVVTPPLRSSGRSQPYPTVVREGCYCAFSHVVETGAIRSGRNTLSDPCVVMPPLSVTVWLTNLSSCGGPLNGYFSPVF
jgi:hypothetical protein